MILDLHRQGLSVAAIARRTGRDPKTVRKYIERWLEPPVYGPRQVGRPNKIAPYLDYPTSTICASASPPSPNSARCVSPASCASAATGAPIPP